MDRITAPKLRDAFAAYQRAYAMAGLHTTIQHPDGERMHDGIGRPWVTYVSGALDLVLTEPDAYRAGSISVEPWHNPVSPQRWDGASGSSSPAGVSLLGNTMREAYDRLTGMTGTLYAVVGAERDGLLSRDDAALAYLDAEADR